MNRPRHVGPRSAQPGAAAGTGHSAAPPTARAAAGKHASPHGRESRYLPPPPPSQGDPEPPPARPVRHRTRTTWTAEEVRALGVQTDVETAGSIFGLSTTQAYVAVNNGVFPVDVIKVGRRYLVPTAPILRLLGIDPE
jgi:hypothetical protein